MLPLGPKLKSLWHPENVLYFIKEPFIERFFWRFNAAKYSVIMFWLWQKDLKFFCEPHKYLTRESYMGLKEHEVE